MRKGFTLLELIIVIIIIGVLATLGFTQYTRMVEKARGAEAKMILGDLRKKAAAFRLEKGSLVGVTNAMLDITANAGDLPVACAGQASHYFRYMVGAVADPVINLTAVRCTTGNGKTPGAVADPNGVGNLTLNLETNFVTGVDTWTGTGPWD